jgi:phospholipid/cholesterol/gamma-HCH transport system permease protein
VSGLAIVGRALFALFDAVGGAIAIARLVGAALATRALDVKETLRQTERFLVEPMALYVAGSALTGGIVAIQGLGYVDRYSATEVFGWAAGLSAYREVGPLLLGLALAARAGSRNAAELAALQGLRRLDALRALGVDVDARVVAPRAAAIVLAALFLFPLGGAIVLATSFALAFLLGGLSPAVSYHSFAAYLGADDVLHGLLRMLAFGAFAALFSTHYGRRGGSSAYEIGRQVFRASVAMIASVVVVNFLLSLVAGA